MCIFILRWAPQTLSLVLEPGPKEEALNLGDDLSVSSETPSQSQVWQLGPVSLWKEGGVLGGAGCSYRVSLSDFLLQGHCPWP